MEILILSLFVNFPINRSSCYNTIIWIKQASILSERDSFILEFYNRTEDRLFRVYDVYSYSVHRIRGGTKGSVWYRRAHPPLQPRLFRGNGCFNDFHLSVRLASWMHRPVCDSTIELEDAAYVNTVFDSCRDFSIAHSTPFNTLFKDDRGLQNFCLYLFVFSRKFRKWSYRLKN